MSVLCNLYHQCTPHTAQSIEGQVLPKQTNCQIHSNKEGMGWIVSAWKYKSRLSKYSETLVRYTNHHINVQPVVKSYLLLILSPLSVCLPECIGDLNREYKRSEREGTTNGVKVVLNKFSRKSFVSTGEETTREPTYLLPSKCNPVHASSNIFSSCSLSQRRNIPTQQT